MRCCLVGVLLCCQIAFFVDCAVKKQQLDSEMLVYIISSDSSYNWFNVSLRNNHKQFRIVYAFSSFDQWNKRHKMLFITLPEILLLRMPTIERQYRDNKQSHSHLQGKVLLGAMGQWVPWVACFLIIINFWFDSVWVHASLFS